jgi:hypothetical protein
MDTLNLIGSKELDATTQRDAIHIAVAPLVAGQYLWHGKVRISELDGRAYRAEDDDLTAVGVVDPFITDAVAEGDRFFVFLFPNTITDIKHTWTHPAFMPRVEEDEEDPIRQIAKEELTAIAKDCGMSYNEMIRAVERYIDTGNCVETEGSGFRDNIDDEEKFWRLILLLTGRRGDGELFACCT